jgi:hypothetical protein
MSDQSDIARDLQADGQAMTLTRMVGGTLDPVTSTATGGVPQSWTVYGITKGYKLSSINTANSLILSGDKQAIIGFSGVAPQVGDKLTIIDIDWQIMAVDELSPQGEALMFYCNVRK